MKRTIVYGVAAALVGLGAASAQQGAKITSLVDSSLTMSGQAIAYPAGKPKIAALLGELAPGGETGKHAHPYPQLTYILQGEVLLELEDGSKHQYKAGEAFLDAVGVWHNAKNIGSAPAKFLVVAMGEKGKSTTVRPH